MGVQFNKNGVINCDYLPVKNLYSGTQYTTSNVVLTYNYSTDIFKEYGFDTCTKMEPIEDPYYWDESTGQFLAYSYIMPIDSYVANGEYYFTCYAYVSTDCNANLQVRLERDNMWVANYQGAANHINDSTKGKVIWVWGKFTVNSEGKMYCMFYPNPNHANMFTTGYMLFTGMTVYKGNQLLKPMNNGVSGSGFVEIDSNAGLSNHYLQAQNFYEI